MKLQNIPFEQIRDGSKTLEIRLNDEKRRKVKVGDQIEFALASDTSQRIQTKVENLYEFSAFKDLFYSFDPLEYGGKSREDFGSMYEFYTKEDEDKYGVVGIKIMVLI